MAAHEMRLLAVTSLPCDWWEYAGLSAWTMNVSTACPNWWRIFGMVRLYRRVDWGRPARRCRGVVVHEMIRDVRQSYRRFTSVRLLRECDYTWRMSRVRAQSESSAAICPSWGRASFIDSTGTQNPGDRRCHHGWMRRTQRSAMNVIQW